MPPVVHPSKSDSNELVSVTVPVMIIMWSQQSIHQPKNIRMTYAKGSSVVRKQMCKTTLKLMLQNGIRADVAMCSTATRTCACAREARASGTTRSSVGLHRRGRALLGHRIKRPGGDLTVIRGHWAPLAYSRVTDVVRRLRVAVVAPGVSCNFEDYSCVDMKACAAPMRFKNRSS